MEQKMRNFCLVIFLILLSTPIAFAATASIAQSGADSGTVMKGQAFSLTVSGLAGSGQATLQLPSGFSISEETTKSFSSSSLSWTTITATERLSRQEISVLISIAGSPSTATTSSFNVVLPPSLSITAAPSSKALSSGQSFDLSLNVQNNGETTARSVIAAISLPSGLSTSDSESQAIGTINGGTGGAGGSSAVTWTIAAGTVSTSTISITVTSSNSDTKTLTVPISAESDDEGINGGGSGPGGILLPAQKTAEFKDGKFIIEGNAGETVKYYLGNESHSIKIESIKSDSVELTIQSVSIKDSIKLGETKQYDINNNSINDISITLANISNNSAILTVALISSTPKAQASEQKMQDNTSQGEQKISGKQQEATSNKQLKDSEQKSMPNTTILMIFVLIAMAAIVILWMIFLFKKHSPKRGL